jgi:hypothetical protein
VGVRGSSNTQIEPPTPSGETNFTATPCTEREGESPPSLVWSCGPQLEYPHCRPEHLSKPAREQVARMRRYVACDLEHDLGVACQGDRAWVSVLAFAPDESKN